MTDIALRPASADDCHRIFEWRNHPFIMARGSSQRPVTWQEHVAWFNSSRALPEARLLLVITCAGVPAGLVRFDRGGEAEATISIYLTETYTGRGLGVIAIGKGCQMLRDYWPVKHIVAHVREDNPAAMQAFMRAGFAASTASCLQGHKGFIFSL